MVVVSHVKKQSVTQNSSTAGPLVGALSMDPLTPVYDPYQTDELYGGFGVSKYVSQEVVNPVARIHYSNGRTLYTTMKGSVFCRTQIPEGLPSPGFGRRRHHLDRRIRLYPDV